MKGKKASFSVAVLVLTLLFITVSYFVISYAKKKTEDATKKTFLHTAEVLLGAVNPERIQKMSATLSDLESSDYVRVKDQMMRLGKAFAGDQVASFYIMARNKDQIRFLVDSLPVGDPDYSPPGELYREAPQELLDVFENGRERFIGPYTDEYGTFISYFVPVRKFGDNTIVGVLGTDIDYGSYTKMIQSQQYVYVALLFVFYFLLLTVMFYVLRRKESQKMLRESEERLRVITNTTPDAVVMMDHHGVISFWNRAAEFITGYSKKEALENNFCELISLVINPEYSDGKKGLKEFITPENLLKTKTVEVKIKTKDGEEKNLEFSVSPIQLKGVVHAIGAFRDITDRKKNDEIVKSKKEELEKLNRFMINREEKMIELKAEIEKLKNRS